MSFAHVTLATRDVEKTATFLERTMRWPRVPIPANAPVEVAWIQLGPRQQIHVLHVEGFEPSSFEREFGRHVAVFHPAGDFAALKQRLIEYGATLVEPIRPTPFDRFFFKDPNGYMFEVIAQEQYVAEGEGEDDTVRG
jgi:catechol 2,3-dioxygenase-like lactoylglutathione lyase family enzyme